MTDQFTYSGEALLLSWTDSSAGRKVTFLLPDNGKQHPFKDFKTGPVHGQPFGIGCKPLDYDNPEPEPEEKERKHSAESQVCGRLCKDGEFQGWLARQCPTAWGEESEFTDDHEEIAAVIVRATCNMHSRKVLDSDPEGEPSQRWQRLKAKYYSDTGKVAERTR